MIGVTLVLSILNSSVAATTALVDPVCAIANELVLTGASKDTTTWHSPVHEKNATNALWLGLPTPHGPS